MARGHFAPVLTTDPITRWLFEKAKRRRMSDRTIAARLGYDCHTVLNWRNGRIQIKLSAARDFATMLGLELALVVPAAKPRATPVRRAEPILLERKAA